MKFLFSIFGIFKIYFCIFLVAFFLLNTQETGMIYSFLFVDPVNNLNYFNNLQEIPPGHPFNSMTPLVTCSTTFANDPAIDSFCIRTKYGLHFPKSNDGPYEIVGDLERPTIDLAYPHYTLLTRIYIDPTKVDSDQENGIRFGVYWRCGEIFKIGFVIKFINPGKIKIYVYAEYKEKEGYYGNTPEYVSEVPEITSPTWVDAALYFIHPGFNLRIPICLNERLYKNGADYHFMPIYTTIHTGRSHTMYNWPHIDSMNFRIISSKAFGMTVQFVGMNSGGTTTDILIPCITNFEGYLVPREFCNLASTCYYDSCCCEMGDSCINSCPEYSLNYAICSTNSFPAQCSLETRSFTTTTPFVCTSRFPQILNSGKGPVPLTTYTFATSICFIGLFVFALALFVLLLVRH